MRVWMIGCGNMGGAMLRRWIDSGVIRAGDVDVVNRSDRALPPGVRQARTLPAGDAPDLVVLAVKPQQLADVATRHAARVAGARVIVSILAGVDEAVLAHAFPGPVAVPSMPNLPVEIGRGVVALHAPSAGMAARALVDALMAPLGLVVWHDDAARFAAVGALSGCGPAFLFRVIDAFAAAGVANGLSAHEAQAVAMATVEGAAAMASASDRSPAALADAVASPGGMTRAGLDVLDADGALAALMTATLTASIARGAQMAAAARG